MALSKIEKESVMQDFHRHSTDTGSPEVQIALLTTRILQLTEHLKDHNHDEQFNQRESASLSVERYKAGGVHGKASGMGRRC